MPLQWATPSCWSAFGVSGIFVATHHALLVIILEVKLVHLRSSVSGFYSLFEYQFSCWFRDQTWQPSYRISSSGYSRLFCHIIGAFYAIFLDIHSFFNHFFYLFFRRMNHSMHSAVTVFECLHGILKIKIGAIFELIELIITINWRCLSEGIETWLNRIIKIVWLV